MHVHTYKSKKRALTAVPLSKRLFPSLEGHEYAFVIVGTCSENEAKQLPALLNKLETEGVRP